MITEDYCSYEVSKLLNEKGLNGMCDTVIGRDGTKYDIKLYDYVEEETTSCPTHQMAMKWLREVHKIFVEVSVCIDTNGDYHYHSMALDKICEYILPSTGTYDTYEEAVEAAILYVLNKVL